MGEVFLAGERHFDRHALHLLRDFGGELDEFKLQPMPKTAADELIVKGDLVRLHVQHIGHLLQQEARQLMPRPNRCALVRDLNHRVKRFQRLMRDVPGAVFDFCRGSGQIGRIGIADGKILLVKTRVSEGGTDLIPVVFLLRGKRRWPPFAVNGIQRAKGPPSVVRDHRDTATDRHHPLNPAHGFRLACVIADQATKWPGIGAHSGVFHALYGDIDAVGQGSRRLGRNIQPHHVGAQQLPRARIPQRHVTHGRNACCGLGQCGVGDFSTIGQNHVAVGRAQVRNGHIIGRRRRQLERFPCRSPGCPQFDKAIRHARRATGPHCPQHLER